MSENPNPLKILPLAMELGYTIAIPLVVFALGGRFLDKKFDSSPLFILSGILLALITTSILLYRKIKNIKF